MNMKTVYLNNFMSSVVTELERNGQYSTAHVCGSVLRSVMAFDGDGLLLSGITPLWLKAYEYYLLHKGEKAWSGIPSLPICVCFGQFITGR
ncbi:MAG: phage integrase SAM-like domain-containing protein [Bacteroides cellulosilyticus]